MNPLGSSSNFRCSHVSRDSDGRALSRTLDSLALGGPGTLHS